MEELKKNFEQIREILLTIISQERFILEQILFPSSFFDKFMMFKFFEIISFSADHLLDHLLTFRV